MPAILFDSLGWSSWNVPKGIKDVEFIVLGGGVNGVKGGRVEGHMAVKDTDVLWIYVGEEGNPASGVNGGAAVGGAGGAGGKASSGKTGGGSGAGASYVRLNSKTTGLKCVAGGAGGRSGDGGLGGPGGAAIGQVGTRGTDGVNDVGLATGGTQTQGGNMGTSSAGAAFNGHDAGNGTLDRGGAGGGGLTVPSFGGGGGGGGYRSGGGGCASSSGYSPGGGGGGGSNYVGGIKSSRNAQGEGSTTRGSVRLEWVSTAAANDPPNTPTGIKVNNRAEAAKMWTKAKNSVELTAVVDDPNKADRVRIIVQYSPHSNMSGKQVAHSKFVHQKEGEDERPGAHTAHSGVATAVLDGLSQNTLYYCHVWAEDERGKNSLDYNGVTFWTNRSPTAPTQKTPAENVTYNTLDSISFSWTHHDPDPSDPQSKFDLRYRRAGDETPAGITTVSKTTAQGVWVSDPGLFNSNQFYEWQVRTYDQQNKAGAFSVWKSFYVEGVSTPPRLKSPLNLHALDVGLPQTFKWQFEDPNVGDSQSKADLQYRVVGTTDWIFKQGTTVTPGKVSEWTFPPDTFQPGYAYEWQVRTYDTIGGGGVASQWSDSGSFATTPPTGQALEPPVAVSPYEVLGTLGCGMYRVFIFERGGTRLLGEIAPLTTLTFERIRDDMSSANLLVTGFGPDCGELLAALRSWIHELVIFRDGVRVWEGPVTRITYQTDAVGVEAKDVSAYLYRRIMRQGYDDHFRLVRKGNGKEEDDPAYIADEYTGQVSVVTRARQIIMNALALDDPNVLPYLTTYEFPDDATQGRVVADFSKSAFEEVDDLAATAGLDYTVIGRRILLWDTSRPIGRLPQMRDGDFGDSPIVSEYGMQLANFYAVTNNSGLYATARPENEETPGQAYGPIELIASAYGETDSLNDLTKQAIRNLSNRWPTPLVVRVPDNSTLSPNCNITFDQLVPGVWIPLLAFNTLRKVAQWQKLDRVNVEFSGGNEQVKVVMAPAPKGGIDPDADTAAIEAAG